MKKLKLSLLMLTVALGAVGCGGAGDALIGNKNPRVRVVNAFPGLSVNASFTDNVMTQNVMAGSAFGTSTVEFIPNNGDDKVTFFDAATATELVNKTSLYELNHDYTVVGFGGAGARNVLIASDAASPLFGQTAFRVMNVSSGAVDVYQGDSGSTFAASTKIRDNLASAAIFPYQTVAAGTIRVFITGSNDTIVKAFDDFTLESGKTYTLIVAENPGTVLFKINSF